MILTSQTKTPNTVVDDGSIGTEAWFQPTRAEALDGNFATVGFISGFPESHSIKLVKADVVSGNDKATGTTLSTTLQYDYYFTNYDEGNFVYDSAVIFYDSHADKWGLTLTPYDINKTTFGIAASFRGGSISGQKSHYLKATNFGFNIPTHANITGVEAQFYENRIHSFDDITQVDVVNLVVYYSTPDAQFINISSISNISTLTF